MIHSIFYSLFLLILFLCLFRIYFRLFLIYLKINYSCKQKINIKKRYSANHNIISTYLSIFIFFIWIYNFIFMSLDFYFSVSFFLFEIIEFIYLIVVYLYEYYNIYLYILYFSHRFNRIWWSWNRCFTHSLLKLFLNRFYFASFFVIATN